ncbi:hypothetical protein BO99DRAFT_14864 [Aspergillus violaceofuscus CBS 115571]|uniref:Uncharacterized protein n=1 Tax=Aspergillus violaceofuscus (strain CBS 115571) TaxID=1450538 RepID=A0A2V5GUJ2_ASPV1|nr:hypothetical protein BO99DRAFT_14864 [Aspergillus violaceofuscus CBS 115571]
MDTPLYATLPFQSTATLVDFFQERTPFTLSMAVYKKATPSSFQQFSTVHGPQTLIPPVPHNSIRGKHTSSPETLILSATTASLRWVGSERNGSSSGNPTQSFAKNGWAESSSATTAFGRSPSLRRWTANPRAGSIGVRACGPSGPWISKN